MRVLYTTCTLNGRRKYGQLIEIPDGSDVVEECVKHRLVVLGRARTPDLLLRCYDGTLNTTHEAVLSFSWIDGSDVEVKITPREPTGERLSARIPFDDYEAEFRRGNYLIIR